MIPSSAEELTPSWLSKVLGTQVEDVHVLDAHSGTTGRVRLQLSYEKSEEVPEPNSAEQPETVFVKLPPSDVTQRSYVVSTGMGKREARFYRGLAHKVPVRVPHCYFAESDGSGEHYVMLLEDLNASQCRYRNASDHYSLQWVRSVLAEMAAMHARFWNSKLFSSDLSWVEPPLQHESGSSLVAVALKKYGATMPEMFTELAELYVQNTDAIHKLWNQGPQTLVHGDAHDGNLFAEAERPGFLDWALVSKTNPMRDVAYFLAATLKPEDRAEHEKPLLEYYRRRMRMHGIAAFNEKDIWQAYRLHVPYVWMASVTTLAMGEKWQPGSYVMKSLERLNRVVADLECAEAIRTALLK